MTDLFPITTRSTTNEPFTFLDCASPQDPSKWFTDCSILVDLAFFIVCDFFLSAFKTFRGNAEAAKDKRSSSQRLDAVHKRRRAPRQKNLLTLLNQA
jgi:hypothetical protein